MAIFEPRYCTCGTDWVPSRLPCAVHPPAWPQWLPTPTYIGRHRKPEAAQ